MYVNYTSIEAILKLKKKILLETYYGWPCDSDGGDSSAHMVLTDGQAQTNKWAMTAEYRGSERRRQELWEHRGGTAYSDAGSQGFLEETGGEMGEIPIWAEETRCSGLDVRGEFIF